MTKYRTQGQAATALEASLAAAGYSASAPPTHIPSMTARPARRRSGTRAQSVGTRSDGHERNVAVAPRRYLETRNQPGGRAKTMAAKYESDCRDCGERILVGEQQIWAKGQGARHVDCPEPNSGDPYPDRTADEARALAPVATGRPASRAQVTLIETLQAERGQPVGAPEALTSAEASTLIPALIAMPRISRGSRRIDLCGCPEGRYAVATDEGHLAFYNVTERGVFLQTSDTLNKLSAATEQAIIAKIMVDPGEAARAYGRELGCCGVCNRTLTNDISRANGIGPVCSAKTGW
jgi:hypothetical protein